ncbi:bifunctional 2-C-methyl-D-erythritol 4-phosphate cytidylyltransferase/2-C-methyl-D-erythritol 2,4-cyclodiphosphate synthase [Haematobacter massiliensis]|nr:bifunctional 2-C-methyl-D-erythritol 4-phosphate cytidylyltransferase/2-C-methyl-D-erythritol 2,4-cyclodiphosphate synthase [Haematobacter massiliensis]OWJ87984.1 bifunctional 2-C-methyl-D-erythritol 4-phosphate cytidylyltransferase/2-C-methyl-D-erythritol 2,4-cyclodiphosphate synthase [Haematobacter massiliensis]QBJ25331.1 bifunctional 2-C-methyl-D-erythritol 4-phosphate cytidylyltransferase/2-C-methyl-D-erythritol 2,4-cyclodiphosphate synthase [Haematobacter massiliensis]
MTNAAATGAKDDVAALIVAAGRGTRAGGEIPKQWQILNGRPVLLHTVDAFRRAGIARIVLVIHHDDTALAQSFLREGVTLVMGGDSRDTSVRAGLDALGERPPRHVLIHDGARPLVSPALVARLSDALERGALAAAPGLAVTDALWRGVEGRVAEAVPRAGLYRAQTPQAFEFAAIRAAHLRHPGGAADDVEVARAAGLDVMIVEGDEDNIKITHPGDFDRAARLLAQRETAGVTHPAPFPDIRTGNGYDVHRFREGDGVVLCGIRIPFDQALEGHSDADVAMHAVTDAIYGALAEGDIGRHFPPSDPQWKGAASEIFLAHAAALVRKRGFALTHTDVTIVCEAPKIGPHAPRMQAEMARIMGLEPDRVSVKATTSERLGFTGRGEGIAALATATLVKA